MKNTLLVLLTLTLFTSCAGSGLRFRASSDGAVDIGANLKEGAVVVAARGDGHFTISSMDGIPLYDIRFNEGKLWIRYQGETYSFVLTSEKVPGFLEPAVRACFTAQEIMHLGIFFGP